jgi:hypothetical protein
MHFSATHLKRIVLVLAVAALAVPAQALAGKPEAKQAAAYMSGVVEPREPSPAESGRAEARQIATFLTGVVGTPSNEPTPAESSRAETKAIAGSLQVAMTPPQAVRGNGGFDWGDAGIGAAAMLGVLLLMSVVGAGLTISRHNRRQVAGT